MSNAIAIKTYPPNLSTGDLLTVMTIARDSFASCPPLLRWMNKHVQAELDRRDAEGTDAPREVEVPEINCASWSNAELARALIATGAARDNTREHRVLNQFLSEIAFVVQTWCAQRLMEGGARKETQPWR